MNPEGQDRPKPDRYDNMEMVNEQVPDAWDNGKDEDNDANA